MVILWDGKRNHKVILYSHLSLKKERGYMICGIYCIENKINNKKYIGQSIDIEKRLTGKPPQTVAICNYEGIECIYPVTLH